MSDESAVRRETILPELVPDVGFFVCEEGIVEAADVVGPDDPACNRDDLSLFKKGLIDPVREDHEKCSPGSKPKAGLPVR